ncbi:histidine kinase N-terminal 7TM domain-containing protein [Echinicola sediminis]
MDFTLGIYSISLLIFAVFTVLAALLLFMRLSKDVQWFGAMMIAVSIWAASDGIMVATDDLEKMLFVVNFEYVGIALVPVFWLLFTLRFVGYDQWLTPKWIAIQFVFPVLTLLMVWTNSYHHLHYRDAQILPMGDLYGLITSKGPWYLIHTSYFYGAITFGVVLLIRRYLKTEGIYRKQTVIILLGTLIPWIANILVVFQVGPFNGLDPTPHAFMMTCLIVVFGFVELRLFDVKPIARNKVIDSMRNGMMVVDGEERVVDINPYFLDLLGMSLAQVTGARLGDLGCFGDEWKEILKSDKEEHLGMILHVGGEDKHFEVNCKFINGGSKRYDGRLLMFRDISQFVKDQKRLEAQAKELTKLNTTKDRLLSIISHDIKAPLNSLTQFLNMAGSGMLTDKEIKSMLPVFEQNLKHVSGFMENLLVWAKSQLHGENVDRVEFDLIREIEDCIGLFKSSLDEKGIILMINKEGSSLVYADLNMISLVIRNLISNAIKFCQTGDQITITVRHLSDEVEVRVKDSGVGIEEKNFKRIFSNESFTTYGTQKERGTGLGLMLCKDFVEKNGGKIWVESEVGEGAKFFFTVPSAMAQAERCN